MQEPLEVKASETFDTKRERAPQRLPVGLIVSLIILTMLFSLSVAGNLYLMYSMNELKTRMDSDAKVVKDVVSEKEDIKTAKESLEKEIGRLKDKTASLTGQFDELKKDKEFLMADLLSSKETNAELQEKIEGHNEEVAELKELNAKYRGALEKEKESSKKLAQIIKNQEDEIGSLKTARAGAGDLAANSNYEAAHSYELGYLYAKAGMFNKAIDKFKKFIELSGENAEAYFNMAYIYENGSKDRENAIKYYKKYLTLKPDAEDVYDVRNKIESLARVGAKKRGSTTPFRINLDKLKY